MTELSAIEKGPAAVTRPALARLLRPRSVAIVGASPERHTIGGGVLANLETFSYAGAIHLVSRSREEINGRRCVKSIAELPKGVDTVVLIVPQAAVREAVTACIAREVGGVVVLSSGFAEAGEVGTREQEALAAVAREAGLALLGPNCLGFSNYADGIVLTPEPLQPQDLVGKRAASIIAQSGAAGSNIRQALQARGIGVPYVITTGNEAVCSSEDFLGYLIDDPATHLIALYVEQIRRPASFRRLARMARERGKPIVMLHPGSSELAQQSARSHTGALAHNHAVMQALVRGEGVAVVDSLDELFDVATVLAHFPHPSPGGTAVVTNSGAFRVLALDQADALGLSLVEFEAETQAQLRKMLPEYIPIEDPLDLGTVGFAQPTIFGDSAAVVLRDRNVGNLLISLIPGSPHQQLSKAQTMIPALKGSSKPVVVAMVGDEWPLIAEMTGPFRANGIPLLRSPERGLRALTIVSRYAERLHANQSGVETPKPLRIAIGAKGPLPEHRGKEILRSIGIRVPKGALARTLDEAIATAEKVGFPVVMKAQAAALTHKSDVGGVILGIGDATQLRDAWTLLHDRMRQARPDLPLDGVLVEEMATDGLEMIVGARRDPHWGPVVMVGLGGVWIEALNDVRILPPDVGRETAAAEIGRLKGAKLLGEFRGRPARDVAAVADVAVKLGALMRGTPDIAEVDINPLAVYASGKGAMALDALFVAD